MRSAVKRAAGVVDMHSHFLPRTWPDFAARFGGENWPSMRHDGALPDGTFGYGASILGGGAYSSNPTAFVGRRCDAMLMSGGEDFRPVTRACWDAAARVEDLDRCGIDHQIISATPILFQWSRAPAVAADVARYMNDAALEMCAEPAAAGRLSALCQVPLQDVGTACTIVDEAMASGHRGVQIGNHVGDRDLGHADLVAFLRHCADVGAPVLVHPWDMCNPDGRLDDHMMQWTVGMPLETHLSITSMILGGAFDELPASLKLCFAHGGGAFPYLLGRLDNAYHQRSVARGKARHPPSAYVDRFSVDSAVFDPCALDLLVKTMGEDRVMLGSDYPFPLGEQDIGALARSSDLGDAAKAKVLGENAAAFFGLPDAEAAVEPLVASC